MKQKYHIKPQKQRRIASERIEVLFIEANKMFKEDPSLSDKYVQLARRIAMKYKVGIPVEFKRMICKNCHKYLMLGVNCRIRTRKGHMVYYCLSCKGFMRVGYGRRKTKKKGK